MEGNEGGVERRGWGRFNEPCLRVFFKWEGGGFEGIRWGKIPLQPPIFNSPKLGLFGGEWFHLYLKKVNCQLCPCDVNLYLFL